MTFAKSIYDAIGQGVPCHWPCSRNSIPLLQIIEKKSVKRMGGLFSKLRGIRFLAEIGSAQHTLIDLVQGDPALRDRLQLVVEELDRIQPYSITPMITRAIRCSHKEFKGFIGEGARVLAQLGLEASKNSNWTLSFGDPRIMMWIAPKSTWEEISRIIEEHYVIEHRAKKLRVVSAIYVINGGLQYKASTNVVRTGTFALSPRNAPVAVTATSECNATGENEIIVAGGGDHIIAIEYTKLELRDDYVSVFVRPVDIPSGHPPAPEQFADVHRANDMFPKLVYFLGLVMAMVVMFLIGTEVNKPFPAPEQNVAMDVHRHNDMLLLLVYVIGPSTAILAIFHIGTGYKLVSIILPAITMLALFLIGTGFDKPFQAAAQTEDKYVNGPDDKLFQLVVQVLLNA